GRIGLAVAPGSRGARVYATIDAGDASGLYRSDDGGGSWQRVNPTASLAGAYFAMLEVDPKNPDVVYVTGQSLRRSTDGGKTFSFFRGAPGGDDYHFLWIDPDHPERMITGADQGTVVTVNGGETWSSWYNQPTGQFYHVATDDRFPYWIYSGQQDSGTVAVASRSDYGQLTFRDWHPVGGDERDYDIPFPGDPDIVYGSGLGGRLSRWDAKTGQVQNVAPWPVSSYGQRPTTVRYRTTWITPFAISNVAPHAIYLGMQVLFRSLDGGQTWETVSPDLTGGVAGRADAPECGGNVAVDKARACGYGAISTIAPSPLAKDVVWVGSDSGMVHVTRDGGKTWQDVTPRGVSEWSRVSQIDASAADAGTAYAAVDRHRRDDLKPYAFVTHDYGKTWKSIGGGLPDDAYVLVVRQDPKTPGLLFAGTRRGVFVSFDDGGAWQALQLNLPTTGVNDLTIHENDLIAATEGRSIWVLDDYTPLRHLNKELLAGAGGATLFPPAPAYRLSPNQNRDTPLPLDEPRAANPPAGAVIDYVLPAGLKGPVSLEVVDAQGQVVRRFASDQAPVRPEAGQYFDDDWLQPLRALPAEPGHNRFVWDLRMPRPRALDYDFSIAAVPGADTPVLPQGLFILPGKYELRLTADGHAVSQPLTVTLDPRIKAAPADLQAQHDFYEEISQTLARITEAQEKVKAAGERLKGPDQENAKRIETELAAIAGALTPTATDVESVDHAPTGPQREVFETYGKRLDTALAQWAALEGKR
ncbi:MAG: WD40/YVTN/BNR-like repeat-containing protein, partial [Thermoanaerobaculia bacterium]